MNTRGLPGMLAPRYQELHEGNSVAAAIAFTRATHSSSARGFASMRDHPCARKCSKHAAIQFACCSMHGSMLLNTDGLPGPVMMNRLGNSAVASPRYVRGPSLHLSFSLRPAPLRIS